MSFDYSNVNFLMAFAGGVITFFASCFLPLIPTYVAYLSGIRTGQPKSRAKLFINSLFFVAGFVFVFVAFGFSAARIGNNFSQYRDLGQRFGGMVMILFGLFLLGAFKPKTLMREFKLRMKINPTKFVLLNSFIFGLIFGFAWSPCIGPLLGVIIIYASQADTAVKGALLLLSYGLGLGIPFIFIAVLFDKLWEKLRFFIKYSKQINLVSGILVLLAGVALLLGKMSAISLFVVSMFNMHFQTF